MKRKILSAEGILMHCKYGNGIRVFVAVANIGSLKYYL